MSSFWFAAKNSAKVDSQDGGFAIRYPTGSLWGFGDTFMTHMLAHPNTALFVSPASDDPNNDKFDIQYVVDAWSTACCIIHQEGLFWCGKHRTWPAAGLMVNDTIYLWYQWVTRTGDSR